MSNKAKVLAVYPDAYCYYSHSEQKFLVWDKNICFTDAKLLGKGETAMWAWQIANELLTKEDKTELYE